MSKSARPAIVCALVLLLSSCTEERSASAGVACSTSPEHFFPVPELQAREKDWYGPELRAMEEPPLCRLASGVEEAYRFVWLRSFHPAIAVRVERHGDEYALIGKRLSQARYEPGSGWESGDLVVDRSRRLRREHWKRLAALVDSAQFWSPETATRSAPEGGVVDGAQWILEGVRNGRYRVLDRWSPEEIEVEEPHFVHASLYLLDLAGLRPDTVALIY